MTIRERSTPETVEPERYELQEPPAYHFHMGRRDFFKVLGAGIVVLCVLGEEQAPAQESGGRRRGFREQGPQELDAWLHIAPDGQVTVFTGKAEVGQNIRTSLAQQVAEELRVPVAGIQMVMGDTRLTPYDMGTFGSRSTPFMGHQLRAAAAAARELLLDLGAQEWKVDRARLSASDGRIVNVDTGAALDYGKLAGGKKLTQVIPANAPLTPPEQWKIAGTPVRKEDARDFVTGRHQFTPDVKLPGMLHGNVLRPESYGATLISVDASAAAAMPGVAVVRDGDFVGVSAPTEHLAARAVKAIRAEWKTKPQISDRELFDYLERTGRGTGEPEVRTGSIGDALAAADVKLAQTYTAAYIQHVPLEPRAAVAEWEGDRLTVWTGTQRPFGVRQELAQAFRMPEESVRVIVPDTGSGYGGKHTGEAAVEAARLAKAAGKPVKLVWTREEEFTWAYFRPAALIHVSSGARKDGTLTAWEFHNINSGNSGIRTLYDVPNQLVQFHPVESPLRQGSYRALAATANHFARESHMDELAYALGMDPLEFRMRNLQDERLHAVFKAAAERFGWGTKPAPGRGFGIAGGSEKGGYVATCAEVEADRATGQVRVVRAVNAFECGAVVNPEQLRNQLEGALVMGLGGALFEHIRFADGKILNARLAKYRVPRFSDAPQIEAVLVDRKDLAPAGAGEIPLVGIAPAVGNAIFAATGVRLRSMPLVPEGLKS